MVDSGGADPFGDPTHGEPSEEEMRAAIEEQLRNLRVEDVVLQSVATLMSLAGRRLGLAPGSEGERDLAQAQLAIDGTRALVGLIPDPQAGQIREALSQVQLAFAQLSGQSAPQSQETPPAGPAGEDVSPSVTTEVPPAEGGLSEEERARARAKIWTPGS
ncbi:MAG: hypothetical protein H0U42_01355 [Thermoleophilaceae bacterium]|nr:hypothetical protein [Thermoleophilaceae bacterium]